MKSVITLLLMFSYFIVFGQEIPHNLIKDSRPEYYAIKNAHIYVSPGKKIKGTLLIKGNKIEKVGPFVSIPNGTVELDFSGKTILPAFIDLNSDAGLPEVKRNPNAPKPQLESTKKGAFHWNESIHPEINANDLYSQNEKSNEGLINKGFGYALVHQHDGIARGEGAFVSLAPINDPLIKVLKTQSFYSFNKGVSQQTYPSSEMGSIALLRQTIYDYQWYKANNDLRNNSYAALDKQLSGNLFFDAREKREIVRAQKIADEFNLKFIYLGSGNEYQIAPEIAATKSTVVVPLSFPEAYDVTNPYVSRQIPLSMLKHWESAPANPAVLSRNGIDICLTAYGVKKDKDFWENLRLAIHHGLSEEKAFEALTMTPAKTVGLDNIIGSIEPGKFASFIVYDKNPFEEQAQILYTCLMGEHKSYLTNENKKIGGHYNIIAGDYKFHLEITGDPEKNELKGKVTYDNIHKRNGEKTTEETDAAVSIDGSDINIQFAVDQPSLSGSVSLHGKVAGALGVFEGNGILPNGEWVKWSAIKSVKSIISIPKIHRGDDELVSDTSWHLWYPHMAFGRDTTPQPKNIVIKNATLWTNESKGIVERGAVVIQDGKITFVGIGNYSTPRGAKIIDAQGMHVTSGIIDEHSHIAIARGVNESGQAISAEVSIADVVNPDDINIYRQISGGVTASQLLHGSANPIGGQSALIKLKWGGTADDMLIDNAPNFIKFALGENVKQSNWGDYNTVRFPQTRMGVEQVYYDAFKRARMYKEKWDAYNADPSLPQPQVDLELQVLSEILQHQRFITCHSYVQSEINMLMHVADSMGFTLNTFTHILEGYKVADKMAAHGAGGSTFSDWWAYKYEVNDAIPYNAKLMHDQGVVVAINSDDAEMGRRLNQEAAKAVKYGGMSEEDAWKMVTLNPAKLLHLDDRMGSLKVGKDADVVIWTDNPLSINAKVNYTIIDGAIYYDRSKNSELEKRNQKEKARIISKMLADNKKGKKKLFKGHEDKFFHCNTIGENGSIEENEH